MRRRFFRSDVVAAFALVAIGITIGAFITLAASYTGMYSLEVNPYIEHPEVDVDVPDMGSVVYRTRSSASSQTTNYVQAFHTDLDYDYRSGGLYVDDVEKCFSINGKSMQPTVFTGNLLCGYRYDPDSHEIEEGMIVLYNEEDGNGTVTHRVKADYETTDRELLLQGDNNDNSEHIDVSQVQYILPVILYK